MAEVSLKKTRFRFIAIGVPNASESLNDAAELPLARDVFLPGKFVSASNLVRSDPQKEPCSNRQQSLRRRCEVLLGDG